MASVNLKGFLRQPLGQLAGGDAIKFTHLTTTGEVIKGSVSYEKVGSDGYYDINIEYGNVAIETKDGVSGKWTVQGTTTINQDTTAKTLPDLLNALIPASNPLILQLEAILNDAQEARDEAVAAAGSVAGVAPQVNQNTSDISANTSNITKITSNAFYKSITSEPAFKITGVNVSTNCEISANVDGELLNFLNNTAVVVPVFVNGTDYAIYATSAGLIASNNFTAPNGYTPANSRRIGGFHYQDAFINERSIWDLKYKPTCDDPRGMARTIGGFWSDIYLLNTTPDLLGTSAYNAQIADGASTPKKPAVWGGNGTAQYTTFTQFIATEVLAAYGKRLPNYHEFSVLAHGSVTGYAAGTDPVKTQFDANARSLIGCEQVSGHAWQWGAECWDRGSGSSGYAFQNVDTDGMGEVYSAGSQGVGASLFGAGSVDAGATGSRASVWSYEPWHSSGDFAARGVCDHVQLV